MCVGGGITGGRCLCVCGGGQLLMEADKVFMCVCGGATVDGGRQGMRGEADKLGGGATAYGGRQDKGVDNC